MPRSGSPWVELTVNLILDICMIMTNCQRNRPQGSTLTVTYESQDNKRIIAIWLIISSSKRNILRGYRKLSRSTFLDDLDDVDRGVWSSVSCVCRCLWPRTTAIYLFIILCNLSTIAANLRR
jgi:hypothetical protein